MVERRLVGASFGGIYGSTKDCIRVHGLVCSRREDSLRLGKALLQSNIFDCNKVPTYRNGSS